MDKEKAIELAKMLFRDVRGDIDTANPRIKNLVLNQIVDMDVEPQELADMMIEYKNKFPDKAIKVTSIYDIVNALKKFGPPTEPTLIKPGIFYYHPRLQKTSKPPILRQLESGEFEEVIEKFFLKVNRQFSLNELCIYFHETNKTKSTNRNRDRAAMERVIDACDGNLDLVLYAIDVSADERHALAQKPLKSPIYLMDYIDSGQKVLEERINTCKMAGLDHEI